MMLYLLMWIACGTAASDEQTLRPHPVDCQTICLIRLDRSLLLVGVSWEGQFYDDDDDDGLAQKNPSMLWDCNQFQDQQ